MSRKSKKVLVTGAAGFIGSHLTERLVQSGARVRAFVHYNSNGTRGWLSNSPFAGEIEFSSGDLTDAGSVEKAMKGIDIVFHLGALIAIPYSYDAPSSYVKTNIEGTLNVLSAARKNESLVVHTSTSEVYGSAQRVPIDESHPLVGQSPYSASKIGADKIAESFYLSFGLPVITVRPFNTFGPRQSARAVIPTIISQLHVGTKVKLGALSPTRDLNYVENTVDGFLAAATCKKAIGQVVNIGSGREISIRDLAYLIGSLMGREPKVVCDEVRLRPEGSEVDRLCADASRAHSLLSWRPRFSLEEGLQKTIEWVTTNIGVYRPTDYAV